MHNANNLTNTCIIPAGKIRPTCYYYVVKKVIFHVIVILKYKITNFARPPITLVSAKTTTAVLLSGTKVTTRFSRDPLGPCWGHNNNLGTSRLLACSPHCRSLWYLYHSICTSASNRSTYGVQPPSMFWTKKLTMGTPMQLKYWHLQWDRLVPMPHQNYFTYLWNVF